MQNYVQILYIATNEDCLTELYVQKVYLCMLQR